MSEPILIGIDHGYAAIKTAHCSFPAGLERFDHRPFSQDRLLEYGDGFYLVGSHRQPLQKDKTADDSYYLLTLAAIAMELGVIRCVKRIQEQVRRKLGLSVTTAQIESVLRGDPSGMDERARTVIQAEADQYVRSLLSAMTEAGLDIHAMPVIFMGGGASLLKRRLSDLSAPCRPFLLDDVRGIAAQIIFGV